MHKTTLRTVFPTAHGTIEVGDGLPTYLIAEIGLNHNGSEELAKEMIHAAALSGATFVKFQKRSPSDLATAAFLDAPFEKSPALGRTQREVRERLELSKEAYVRLKKYAESLGLIFFSSVFDIPSLEFMRAVGVKIIKIPSHSITNEPLLKRIADGKFSVIASLGGASPAERDRAVDILKKNPLVLLHCVSAYPTPDTMTNLDTIAHYRDRYGVPVGFSSHEGGIDISIAASVLGACMIERHFTISRAMVGLDHVISLEPHEFSEMASKVKRLKTTRGVSTDLLESEKTTRHAYHVAVCTAKPLKAGTKLTRAMLICKQPLSDPTRFFTGMEIGSVVGKKLTVNLSGDTAIPRSSLK